MRSKGYCSVHKLSQMPRQELCALSAQSWETLAELDAKYDELLQRLSDLEKEVSQVLARYNAGQSRQQQPQHSGTDSSEPSSSPA